MRQFKYGVDIVVEPADEARFDNVVDSHCGERVAHFLEVEFGVVAEKRSRIGCFVDEGTANFLLAVENTPDVAFEPLLAVIAHLLQMRCEVVPQSLFRRRPVRCNAARVQIKREPRDADLVQIMDQHCDTFRIQFGRNLSGVFDADLVKLPSASSRRSFAAEHGADIEYAVFDAVQRIGSGEGAHDSGGSFRAESETASAAVFKRIHLFFHDFGFVAEPALEDFRRAKRLFLRCFRGNTRWALLRAECRWFPAAVLI